MALHVDSPEADKLARELASYTGETISQAVIKALQERLVREKKQGEHSLADRLLEIGRECSALEVQDARASDGIIGYNEHGLPS